MIIWFSLAAAILLFGGQSNAAPDYRRDMSTQPTQTSSTASAVAPSPTASPSGVSFRTTWGIPDSVVLGQNTTFTYSFDEKVSGVLGLVLCQTNATGAEALTSENTWSVVEIPSPNLCKQDIGSACSFGVANNESVSVTFQRGAADGTLSLINFFLCFGTKPNSYPTCESYSPFFDIASADGSVAGVPHPPQPTPSSLIVLSENKDVIRVSGGPSSTASSSSYATMTSIYSTVTATSIPTSAGIVSSTAASVHKSKGLSTGALVGIIIGGVAVLLIAALLAFFCLRRRNRTRSNTIDSNAPEHVLLTQPYHTVSSSRDLMLEKPGSPTTFTSILESPLTRPILPQNPRHSYDSLNTSAPYSGLAAAAPRRKQPSLLPTAQSSPPLSHPHSLSRELSSTTAPLTRGLSSASQPSTRGLSEASGPISPRSTVRGEGDDFEEYHDVPIYGDARHTPTVYQSHASLQAGFLGEEEMSEEEVAQLEEEQERRIDAAIAAAEREEEEGRRRR